VPVVADDAEELTEVFGDQRPTGEYRDHVGIREQLWRRRVQGSPQ
jgi:hypothetical protein